MKTIKKHPLFGKLLDLKLDSDDYVVFGSAPMWLHGLKDLTHDLDILAKGSAWEKVSTMGEKEIPASGVCQVVRLFDGEIEIYNGWWPGEWDIENLISRAQIIDGVRFASLLDVLKWKKHRVKEWDREKDTEHIRLIENYLKNNTAKDI